MCFGDVSAITDGALFQNLAVFDLGYGHKAIVFQILILFEELHADGNVRIITHQRVIVRVHHCLLETHLWLNRLCVFK